MAIKISVLLNGKYTVVHNALSGKNFEFMASSTTISRNPEFRQVKSFKSKKVG